MFPQPIFSRPGKFFQPAVFEEYIQQHCDDAQYGLHHRILIFYALMILFFSYFWVATQFNEIQIADDLKKNGGYIPGVQFRAGHE